MINNSPHKIKVLFVDDEFFNLQSFRAAFRKYFDIYLAQNTHEAKSVLNEKPIEVIISDQRMPDQTGTDFFNEIIKSHPEPIRILLTGYVDIKAVIAAINKGEVYRFLTKPWNDEEVVVTIKNAADVYRTRKELKNKNASLEKAYNELDEFVYSASHDLRAPIASLKGVLQLIDIEPQNTTEYIGMINEIVNKMDKYVINIIHYYRGSRFDKEIEEVDIITLVEELLDEFQYMPEFKDIKVNKHFEIEKKIYSDSIKIYLILRNLIHNAIKYQRCENPQKEVSIAIYQDIPNGALTIQVSDNGMGIDSNEGDEIFKIFQRANNVKSGIGLGLHIVNECVNKLNGQIEYKSQENKGTTFTITLPLNDKKDE